MTSYCQFVQKISKQNKNKIHCYDAVDILKIHPHWKKESLALCPKIRVSF